ncbi:MAG TPA: ABC transporter substrate-binding protein [Chloroflexota bacterium]|nr:ABC transporter substrate-binding protein [Chloroflexota bacterium]
MGRWYWAVARRISGAACVRRRRGGVWLVAVAVGLAACAPPATAPPAASPAAQAQEAPAEPATLQPVHVAYTALVSAQAPLWIAVETGLFREQGLDVDAVLISGSDKAIAALLSGEAPITMLASGAMVSAVAKGADLVYLASTSTKLTFQLMVQPQVTSVEQLRGQPVGATGRGSQSDFALRYALRHLGLDPEQDIVFRAMAGGEPQMLAALQSGAIMAAALNPPNDYVAEQAGFHSLARMADWNVPSLGVGVAVRRGYLAEQRDTVRRFVRGFALGAERMKADPALAQAVIRQYLQSDDGPAIEWGYRAAVEAMPAVPYPSEPGLQSVIDALAEVDPEVATVQPAALVDRSILDEIIAAGLDRPQPR